MLLIERIPTLSIFARNHCGLDRTFTLSILRAEKNGHSRVDVMFTPVFLTGIFDSRAAVWRDLDVENGVGWKKITDRRADLCIWRQNQQTRCIFAEANLDWAAKHSFTFNAAEFAFSNFSSVPQLCSGQRQQNFVADFVIGGPANDLPFRSTAIINFTNRQAIGVRMSRRSGDLRNDHLVDVRAARFDVLSFDAGACQQFCNLFRIVWKVDELA